MATQQEVANALTALTAQLNKIKTEVSLKLQELADAIANQGNASQEVVDALAAAQDAVKQVDDLNPDAIIVEETPTGDPA